MEIRAQVSDSTEKKKTTVFIDPLLMKRVKIKTAGEDLKFQQVVNDALRAWVEADASVEPALPLMERLLDKSGQDDELVRKFLRLWYHPEGAMEPHIRAMVAKAIGVEEPK